MNDLQHAPAMAHKNGLGSFVESSLMAPSLRTGVGSDGIVDGHQAGLDRCNDWPGREYGIRAPGLFETALSWDEVKVALLSIRVALAGQV